MSYRPQSLKGGVNITVLAYQQAIVKTIMSLSDALREKFPPKQSIQNKSYEVLFQLV